MAEKTPLLSEKPLSIPPELPGPHGRYIRPLGLPIIEHLRKKRVVLASASPRRRQFFTMIRPCREPEDFDKTMIPEEYVAATARKKCLSVYRSLVEGEEEREDDGDNDAATVTESDEEPALVISADTIIVGRDGRIIEKPHNEVDNIRMLQYLRDTRRHRVLTTVCVLAPREDARSPGYEMEMHTEETTVWFVQESDGLSNDVIEAYVRTGEGADKSGGYTVQGIGGMILVEKIEGATDNAVGLPVRKTLALAEMVLFRQDQDEDEDEGEGTVVGDDDE